MNECEYGIKDDWVKEDEKKMNEWVNEEWDECEWMNCKLYRFRRGASLGMVGSVKIRNLTNLKHKILVDTGLDEYTKNGFSGKPGDVKTRKHGNTCHLDNIRKNDKNKSKKFNSVTKDSGCTLCLAI